MKNRNLRGTALVLLTSGLMFGAFGCLNPLGIAEAAIRGLPGGVLSNLLTDTIGGAINAVIGGILPAAAAAAGV